MHRNYLSHLLLPPSIFFKRPLSLVSGCCESKGESHKDELGSPKCNDRRISIVEQLSYDFTMMLLQRRKPSELSFFQIKFYILNQNITFHVSTHGDLCFVGWSNLRKYIKFKILLHMSVCVYKCIQCNRCI